MERRRDIAREIARRYGNVSLEQLDQLTEIIVPIEVHKGVEILKQGEVCKYIYYVDKGLIRQFYFKNNKEVTEHIAYEGGIVMCIESLFKREPSRIAVESLEPARLYALNYDELEKLTHTSYAFCNILFNILKESLILSQQKADTIRCRKPTPSVLRMPKSVTLVPNRIIQTSSSEHHSILLLLIFR